MLVALRLIAPSLLLLLAAACSSSGAPTLDAMSDRLPPAVEGGPWPGREAGAAADRGTVVGTKGLAIFYSDLTGGPGSGGQDGKGAFVSIYGRGFGGARGSSSVTVGGGAVDNYPIWTSTRITFQLGAAAQSGEIEVHVGEGTSNGVPFTVRAGNIYFVGPAGLDSNDGSFGKPWKTLAAAKRKLSPGDILYALDKSEATTADGASSALCISSSFGCGAKAGTAAAPIALVAYPGATVTVGCTAGTCPRDALRILEPYWTVAGLTLVTGSQTYASAMNVQSNAGTAATISVFGQRVVANKLTSGYYGITLEQVADCHVLGNELWGMPNSAIYLGGYGPNDGVEVAWNVVRDMTGAGFGIKAYGHTSHDSLKGFSIHHNLVKSSNRAGILVGGSDGAAPWIKDAVIANNVVWKVNSPGEGAIRIGNAGTDEKELDVTIVHNTVVDCAASIEVDAALTARVQDNLFVQSGGAYTGFAFKATTLTMDHNGYFGGTAAPAADKAPVAGDPKLVDRAGGDFHLQAGSPAANAGVDAGILIDFDGQPRPQGAAPDLGAFELVE